MVHKFRQTELPGLNAAESQFPFGGGNRISQCFGYEGNQPFPFVGGRNLAPLFLQISHFIQPLQNVRPGGFRAQSFRGAQHFFDLRVVHCFQKVGQGLHFVQQRRFGKAGRRDGLCVGGIGGTAADGFVFADRRQGGSISFFIPSSRFVFHLFPQQAFPAGVDRLAADGTETMFATFDFYRAGIVFVIRIKLGDIAVADHQVDIVLRFVELG